MGRRESSDEDEKSSDDQSPSHSKSSSEAESHSQSDQSEAASASGSVSDDQSHSSTGSSSNQQPTHKQQLDIDNAYSDSQSQDGLTKSRPDKRDIIRQASEQPDLYGIRRSGRQRKEVTRLSVGTGSNSDEKPRKRKTRSTNQGGNSESSESSNSNFSDSDSGRRKRKVTRSRAVRTRQSTRQSCVQSRKVSSTSEEESESEESSDDGKQRQRPSKSTGKSRSAKQRSTRKRATKQNVSYKEESDDVTESDDLIEIETTEADMEQEVAETIERIVRNRTGRKGATGSKTTMYNVDKEGDPNADLKMDTDETEPQYLIKWKGWSHMHNTWESDATLHEQKVNGLKKLENYQKKEYDINLWRKYASPEDIEYYDCQQEMMDDLYLQYCQVERIVTDYPPKPGSQNREYLIKWQGLPYCECTQEDGDLIARFFPQAIEQYNLRQKSSCTPSKSSKALKNRPKFVALKNQPDYLGSEVLQLRDYQLEGLNWLIHSWCKENGAILADEMGLGKTIQMIGFLSVMMNVHHVYGPFLLVVPLSTIATWQKEFELWAPQINVIVYIGDVKSRSLIRDYEWCHAGTKKLKVNVVLTTYEILLKDKAFLGGVSWAVLGVDEAHRLKNDDSLLYKVLINFETNHRIFITGTPLQNSLRELWSLLHFIMPYKFAKWEEFEQRHKTSHKTGFRSLHQEIEPFLLRRVKKDVEKSLPAKVEQILRVEMSKNQRQFYRWILTKNYKALSKGVKGSIAGFVNLVMELKKCCNHAFLVRPPGPEDENENVDRFELLVKSSGKLILLDKLLMRLKEAGHRVLIFSQMVRMLDILAEYLQLRRFQYQRLDGMIRGDLRKQAMDHFNAEGSQDFCFLLSTRAGGLGVNLATADTVIIFDSDWNPQNDLQAQARAHRIGQKNQVSVYRLVTKSSVEEEIVERAKQKMVLDHLVIQRMDTSGRTVLCRDGLGGRSNNTPFSKEELNSILKFGTEELFKENDDEEDLQVDIDDILRLAETRNTEEMRNSATDELLSQFKVVNFENLEDQELEGRNHSQHVKDWDEIIPEADRKKVEDEEMQEQLKELNLPPRLRRQVNAINVSDSDVDDESRRHGDTESSEEESDEDKLSRRRARPRGDKELVKGFTSAEIRQLVKSLRKFPRPVERLDDLAADAELQEKSQADLKHVVELILTQCKETMKGYDDKLKEVTAASTTEGQVARRPCGRASFRLMNVSINAKSILQAIDELEPLAVLMPANPKDREKFQLKVHVKMALFDCEWDVEDDSYLLRGVYDHGFGNWEAIKMDEAYKLGVKILPDGDLKPQAKHLQTRAEYLLKVIRKQVNGEAKPKSQKKPRGKPSSKKVKSKELVDDNLVSDSDSDKDKPGGDSKNNDSHKAGNDSHKKTKRDSKLKKEKADGDGKEKKKSEKKHSSKKKNKAGDGPLHFTTNQTVSVDDEGGLLLPPDIFNECKDRMRSVKRQLKQLGDPDSTLSEKERMNHIVDCLYKIGNHIAEILAEFNDPEKIKEWRSYLWVFVSQFTDFDAARLHKLYKQAIRKREEQKDKEADKKKDRASHPMHFGAGQPYPVGKDAAGHHHHRQHHQHHHKKHAGNDRGADDKPAARPDPPAARSGPVNRDDRSSSTVTPRSSSHTSLPSRDSSRDVPVISSASEHVSPLSKDEPTYSQASRYGDRPSYSWSGSHSGGAYYHGDKNYSASQPSRSYDQRDGGNSNNYGSYGGQRHQGYGNQPFNNQYRPHGGHGSRPYHPGRPDHWQERSNYRHPAPHFDSRERGPFDRKRRQPSDGGSRDPRYRNDDIRYPKEPRVSSPNVGYNVAPPMSSTVASMGLPDSLPAAAPFPGQLLMAPPAPRDVGHPVGTGMPVVLPPPPVFLPPPSTMLPPPH